MHVPECRPLDSELHGSGKPAPGTGTGTTRVRVRVEIFVPVDPPSTRRVLWLSATDVPVQYILAEEPVSSLVSSFPVSFPMLFARFTTSAYTVVVCACLFLRGAHVRNCFWPVLGYLQHHYSSQLHVQ